MKDTLSKRIPNVTITVRLYFTENHNPLKVINLYLSFVSFQITKSLF
jgi:hypothetical protein